MSDAPPVAEQNLTAKVKNMNKAKRGFASMTPERQREIASMGGKSVPNDRRSSRRIASLRSRRAAREARTYQPRSAPIRWIASWPQTQPVRVD